MNLKLGSQTHATTQLGGLFGALRDASPDYWGRRIIEKRSGKPQLDELDHLLYSPDDRAGALGFGLNAEPPAPRRAFNRTMELARLQVFADRILADDELPRDSDAAQAHDLLNGGTSMGGARPKAVVEGDAGLWVAKFNRPDDRNKPSGKTGTKRPVARESAKRTAGQSPGPLPMKGSGWSTLRSRSAK